ncbi:universal stress protein [Woeseia oceani]|uniref:Universal stress protein n=1 Tax=Woeseia oceani TaxID=1548547 RepID=A0A193LJP6_9GAMM|nr:universal stress protein [Woeseia oceani]ANO52737.1 universal stress protein [Woeseia oceani]
MKSVKNIIVVPQGSYDPLALVAQILAVTRGSGAKVTLLGVLDPPPDDPDTRVALSNLHTWAAAAQLREFQKIAEALVKEGVEATIKQRDGKPGREIIREVTETDCDLVIKPAESEGRKLEFLFGSTDMQLFRLCPVPVWVFKPTQSPEIKRIMVAVDLVPSDTQKSALADTVLQWGKYVAGLTNAELHISHVWDLQWENIVRGQSVSQQTIDSLLTALEQRHRKWFDDVLAENNLDVNKAKVHLHKGDPKIVLPMVANDEHIDLLVMGTVGRTGIPGFFIGNTAESVLRQATCSVLALKPKGFGTVET